MAEPALDGRPGLACTLRVTRMAEPRCLWCCMAMQPSQGRCVRSSMPTASLCMPPIDEVQEVALSIMHHTRCGMLLWMVLSDSRCIHECSRAACIVQGIVYETMQMANLDFFTSGGTINIICNNQATLFMSLYLDSVRCCVAWSPSLASRALFMVVQCRSQSHIYWPAHPLNFCTLGGLHCRTQPGSLDRIL